MKLDDIVNQIASKPTPADAGIAAKAEVDPTTQLGVLGPAPGFNAKGERVPDDDLALPTFLDRKSPEGPKSPAPAKKALIPYAGKETRKLPVPTAKLSGQDAISAAEIVANAAARKKEVAAVKKEKAEAEKSGATKAMPLEGKAALAAINGKPKGGKPKGGKAKAAKPAAKAKATAPKSTPKTKSVSAVRSGSKAALIGDMLRRKSGCTAAEVMEACNWPSVSMPAQAAAAGVKLRKEKKPGSPTRYYAA